MTDWSTLKKLIWLRIIKGGSAVLKTVTGSLIHITDALALPAEALSVNVKPIQDLHGYDSPWPSGGGKNLLDPAKCSAVDPSAAYGLTVTHDQATAIWTISGTPTSQSASLAFNFCIYSDFSLSGKGYQVQAFPISGTPIKNFYGFRNEAENRIAIIIDTVANPTVNMTFKVSVATTSQTAWSPYSNICPISGRTSATIYHSGADTSDPTTYTIQLGDTVYGGQLDVTAGKMVVDRAMVDMGTIAFAKSSATSSSGGSVFSKPVSIVGLGMAGRARYTPNNILSDVYKTASTSTWWISELPDLTMLINTNALIIADSRYSTADDFRAAVSGVQLVYELATPLEITLTPTQIDMLLGENNLWADAGDLTLTYYADGNASTSEALGILLGGTYNNPGSADDVSDDEALEILLGGS